MPKPLIRSWHRDEFAKGQMENIPQHVLDLLKAENLTRQIDEIVTDTLGESKPRALRIDEIAEEMIEAIASAEMDPRHDHLNDLLDE